MSRIVGVFIWHGDNLRTLCVGFLTLWVDKVRSLCYAR